MLAVSENVNTFAIWLLASTIAMRSPIINKRSDDFGYPKMLPLKELLRQEIENHYEEQLKQLSDFIAFLKFRSRNASWQIDKNQIAAIYSEFAEEDRQLAEEGLDEYTELLRQEDVKSSLRELLKATSPPQNEF